MAEGGGPLELGGLLEVLLVHAASADVAVLGANVGVALARLDVLSLENDAVLALNVDAKACLEIGDGKCSHEKVSFSLARAHRAFSYGGTV